MLAVFVAVTVENMVKVGTVAAASTAAVDSGKAGAGRIETIITRRVGRLAGLAVLIAGKIVVGPSAVALLRITDVGRGLIEVADHDHRQMLCIDGLQLVIKDNCLRFAGGIGCIRIMGRKVGIDEIEHITVLLPAELDPRAAVTVIGTH